jgi:photosystem II stability/assembly factor-like uncharacterized protein
VVGLLAATIPLATGIGPLVLGIGPIDPAAAQSAAGVPTGPVINGLDNLACPSPTVCFAVGNSSPLGNNPAGAVIAATNTGGHTWWRQQPPVAAGGLKAIACPTVLDCFAVGEGQGYRVPPIIVATTDGGRDWMLQNLPDASSLGIFPAIKCPTALRCYAISDPINAPPRLVTTTDGGAHWTNQPGPPSLSYAAGLSCPDATTCFATGSGILPAGYMHPPAAIAATSDGGATWVAQLSYFPSQSTEEDAYIDAVSCPTATTCLAVGSGIWGTTDAGHTWTLRTKTGISFGGPPTFTAVDCPRAIDCYVSNNQYMQTSTNGGWTYTYGPDGGFGTDLLGLSCPTYFRCYGTSGASVVATVDSGQSWTTQTVPGLGYIP